MRAAGVLVVAMGLALAGSPAHAAGGGLVTADPLTLETPKAKRQVELLTRSTLPQLVTGGQVLVQVRGLRSGDRLRVHAGKRDVTRRFGADEAGTRTGLVRGLKRGRTILRARVRRGKRTRVATLPVTDHPVAGPVFSGPHQAPFYCETEQSGLGKPLDANCSAKPRVQWFSRDTTGNYHELTDPYAAYPSDTAQTTTSTGETVPFVVRVESRTINRGIARLAVLDDPHARGADKPFEPAEWNRRLTYSFGESCGVGYHQGTSTPNAVLGGAPSTVGADNLFATVYGIADRVGSGDLVAHSTLTTFGTHCNALVSAETLTMVKEHVMEAYGIPARTVGVGGSGGALQQYNAANTYPGLLDAATPIASFTDVVSTAQTVVDCGLLKAYWRAHPDGWSDAQKAAVAGHRTTSICSSWEQTFLPLLQPSEGCAGIVPRDTRWSPQNPKGVRCTLQDGLRNLVGVDQRTGYARRPYDNVGVQYGLAALRDGTISGDQFVALNAGVGGLDVNGVAQPARSAMPASLARRAYRFGMVVGRGALNRIPVIDLATYLDLIPIADIHDDVRPFQQRARLRKHLGGDGTMQIWRGVSGPADAQPALTSWLDRIDAGGAAGSPEKIAALAPAAAKDRCVVNALGGSIDLGRQITGPLGLVNVQTGLPVPGAPIKLGADVPERQEASGTGLCQSVFTAFSEPRTVAGAPLADDVIKCHRKPVDPADYAGRLSAAQLQAIRAALPTGVCDYTRDGVGAVARSVAWPSVGGAKLRAPHGLRWRVARAS